MDRLVELIKEILNNSTIAYISGDDRNLIDAKYRELFGYGIDKFCNLCVADSLVEISKTKWYIDGEKSNGSVQPNVKGVHKGRNRKKT